MAESLFLLPEGFDNELLDELEQHVDNPDVLYVAGDLSDDLWFEEDEAVSILANYGQVRKYLHDKVLGRGFNRRQRPQQQRRGAPPPPARQAGGTRRSAARNTCRPKKCSKTFFISRSICARCGKKGHWARECTNPPDERGKMRGSLNGFMMIEDILATQSAICFNVEEDNSA